MLENPSLWREENTDLTTHTIELGLTMILRERERRMMIEMYLLIDLPALHHETNNLISFHW